MMLLITPCSDTSASSPGISSSNFAWTIAVAVGLSAFLVWLILSIRIRRIQNQAAADKQLLQLEVKAMKAQMNPHFVFNAMNSVQSLITDNHAEEALKYISRFAKLLRIVLDNSEKTSISLRDELASLELYLKLESLRLDYTIDYRFEIESGVDTNASRVPPLFLQPFVENALWHGLAAKAGYRLLTVTVRVDNDYLVCGVTDNGIGREKSKRIQKLAHGDRASKGFSITQRRLKILNPDGIDPVTVQDMYDPLGEPAGTRVTIRVYQPMELVEQ